MPMYHDLGPDPDPNTIDYFAPEVDRAAVLHIAYGDAQLADLVATHKILGRTSRLAQISRNQEVRDSADHARILIESAINRRVSKL